MRKSAIEELLVDKKEIQRIVAQQEQALGFPEEPHATPQRAREMMRALGIRPEDNEFSRGLIAARDE